MKHLFLFISFTFSTYIYSQDENLCNCPLQSKVGKGTIYMSWGYNRDWFSKSDIHFKNTTSSNFQKKGAADYYDFTLYDVKAKDRPGFDQILKMAAKGDFAIPQYVYRLGYFFNDKNDLGVEINFDHSKYVMVSNQVVRLKGNIRGVEYDQDTLVTSSFLQFEHTNGANFLMLNFIKRKNIFTSANKKVWLGVIVKPGAGIVIPKTDVTLFGERLDNKFHIAGWIAGVETGLRLDLFKHFYLEPTVKGTFADYRQVLVMGNGLANHHFWCFQAIALFGIQFAL